MVKIDLPCCKFKKVDKLFCWKSFLMPTVKDDKM